MEKDNIKDQLPAGAYQEIADATGKSLQTVRMFFSDSEIRVSAETRDAILQEANRIIEERAWQSLRIKYGDSAVDEMQATLIKT